MIMELPNEQDDLTPQNEAYVMPISTGKFDKINM